MDSTRLLHRRTHGGRRCRVLELVISSYRSENSQRRLATRDSLSLIFSIGFLKFWTGRSFAMTSIPKLDAHPEVIHGKRYFRPTQSASLSPGSGSDASTALPRASS